MSRNKLYGKTEDDAEQDGAALHLGLADFSRSRFNGLAVIRVGSADGLTVQHDVAVCDFVVISRRWRLVWCHTLVLHCGLPEHHCYVVNDNENDTAEHTLTNH